MISRARNGNDNYYYNLNKSNEHSKTNTDSNLNSMRDRDKERCEQSRKDSFFTEDRVCASDFKLKVHKINDLSLNKDKSGTSKNNVNEEFNTSEFEVSGDSKEFKLNSYRLGSD